MTQIWTDRFIATVTCVSFVSDNGNWLWELTNHNAAKSCDAKANSHCHWQVKKNCGIPNCCSVCLQSECHCA